MSQSSERSEEDIHRSPVFFRMIGNQGLRASTRVILAWVTLASKLHGHNIIRSIEGLAETIAIALRAGF